MKSNISRRDFIRYSSLFSGIAAVSPLNALSINDPWNLSRGTPQKVIILGAGMSGLAAAMELKKLGHDVMIYEAQMRAGGRVKTLRTPLADNMYADLGAARIPENHDWTMKYIQEMKLDLTPFLPAEMDYLHVVGDKKLRYKKGNPPPLSEYPFDLTKKEIEMGWSGIESIPFEKILANVGDAKSVNWPPKEIASYDKYAFKEFLVSEGYSKAIGDLIMLGYEEPGGIPVSVLELIRELSLSFGAPRNRIVGGNDLLPRRMADQLKDIIQYGTKVTAVEQSDSGVSIAIKRNGEKTTLQGDRVVCTFPCPVLKRFEFVNTLSPAKQKAVREMNYWSLSRTVMQVDERYWRNEKLNGYAHTDSGTEIWDPLVESDSKRGLIAAYIKGSNSQNFLGMSDDERLKFSTDHVNEVFPGLFKHLEGGYTKCWDEDQWAQGAHALGGPNQMTELQPHLGTPEGRIHFAGEHTSAYHGWIQGAIESGNRVAKEINSF